MQLTASFASAVSTTAPSRAITPHCRQLSSVAEDVGIWWRRHRGAAHDRSHIGREAGCQAPRALLAGSSVTALPVKASLTPLVPFFDPRETDFDHNVWPLLVVVRVTHAGSQAGIADEMGICGTPFVCISGIAP